MTHNILSKEFYYIVTGNGDQWFHLYSFGEVIYNHYEELITSRCYQEGTGYVNTLLLEGPCTLNRDKILLGLSTD